MPIELIQIGFRYVFRWIHFLKQLHLSDNCTSKKCVYIVSDIKVYKKQQQTNKINRNFSFPMELVI